MQIADYNLAKAAMAPCTPADTCFVHSMFHIQHQFSQECSCGQKTELENPFSPNMFAESVNMDALLKSFEVLMSYSAQRAGQKSKAVIGKFFEALRS